MRAAKRKVDYTKPASNGLEYCFGNAVHVEVGIYQASCAWTGAQALGPMDDFGFIHDCPPATIGRAIYHIAQEH